jgi:nucleoside-diphosphate-sugar epimerase
VEFIEGDVTRRRDLRQLPKDISYVFHFAAIIGVENVIEQPEEVLRVNAFGTYRIAEFATDLSELKRLIFASTSEVYAGTLEHFGMQIPTPETTPIALCDLKAKRTSYGLSKIFGESTCHIFNQRFDVPTTSLRYHNIYGPRMGYQHVMPEKFVEIQNKERVEVYSPDHTRAFCYIQDAIKATVALAEAKDAINETVNVGNSTEEIDIYSLIEHLVDVIGEDIELVRAQHAPGSPTRRCPDTKRLRQLVDYEPTVSLKEGIRRTYEWYKERL